MIIQHLAVQSPTQSTQTFELRPYQKQVIAELYALIKAGNCCPFLYAPTGSGKTATASKIIADAVSCKRRVLFLIHRDPLLKQTQDALAVYGITSGVIKSGYKEDRSQLVQIASIQSLARRPFPEDIGLVVVDECHTTAWHVTYARLREAYPQAIFLGLTGSPWRTKCTTEFMGQHFDSYVKSPSPKELINMGFLARPRYFGFGGLLDLATIDNGSDGDFNESQMQSACMVDGFNERIVEEFTRLCADRTAIVFCAGVEQSRYLCQLFNKAGIPCEHLEAKTPHLERQGMYMRLALGETRILSSVGTLAEGFDVPSISCVILARPTRSLALLFQMAGRGLRLSQSKRDCFMLDFGSNFERMGYITDEQPIGLEPLKERGKPALKECPSCHSMIYSFLMLCPECGYEFPPGSGDEDAVEFEAEFGEIFSDEDKPKVKYLRQQIRTRFRKRQPLDRLWETFEEKFGHYPPNEWHLGACFGTFRTEVNRQIYLDYLYETNLAPKEPWVRFHMELEFGIPEKRYSSRKGSHVPPSNQHQRLDWWKVLGVLPLADWENIKTAYGQLAQKYHPDTCDLDPREAKEQMQLINWAFEQANIARSTTLETNIQQPKVASLSLSTLKIGGYAALKDSLEKIGKILKHDDSDDTYQVFFEDYLGWFSAGELVSVLAPTHC